jgi:hypothetical protein
MPKFLKVFSVFFTIVAITTATIIFSSLIYSIFGIIWALLYMTIMIAFLFTLVFSPYCDCLDN